MEKSQKIVVYGIWLLVAITLGVTAWLYIVQKDFTFEVEAACDPSTNNCFERDCSSKDSDCPPDNLEHYKVYEVNAATFQKCSADTCAKECENGEVSCKLLQCGESSEDACSLDPEASTQ